MRGNRYRTFGVSALAAGLLFLPGCQTAGSKRPTTVVSPAPGVADADVAEKAITATPVKTTGFAARHPLFSKPREYWETSGNNKVVKAAAATFIGVPAGFVGEVKQIIVGAPPAPSY